MKYLALLLLGLLGAGQAGADWDYMTVDAADGVPLQVVTAGRREQPAIIFIHGIGQSHYSFHRQFNSDLAEDFFLVAFDLRGHGASGKPWTPDAYENSAVWARDVAAVIKATQARQPILVAWSYGTLVAMDYIREFGVADIAGLNMTGALGALRPFRMPATDDPATEEFARIRELQLSPNLVDNIRASELMV
ncbi:MAG: alpha/beta hydrolase, partial [Gammaproteobacteria bacterium]|nr:alpha/beta hydrolase [Gammaproteobacteria bacterium]